jgi:hypothetical protein
MEAPGARFRAALPNRKTHIQMEGGKCRSKGDRRDGRGARQRGRGCGRGSRACSYRRTCGAGDQRRGARVGLTGARCRSRRGESRGGGCPKFDHGVGGSSRLDRLGLRLLDGARTRIVGGSLGSWSGGGGRSIIGGWERDRIRGQRTEFVGRSLATCALRCLLGLSRSLPLEFGEGRARFSSHVTPSDRRPRRAPASETRRRCARSPRVTLILRASSPLRPGRNSNSTRWPFLDVLGAAAPKSGVPAVRA